MTRKAPIDVAASVRARLLKVSKERQEDFTLTLMNYGAERFLYRLATSKHHDHFVLKGAMLFAAARLFFETLDRANRYAILYRVQTARKPDTRADRIARFVAMCARHEVFHPSRRTKDPVT